MPTLRIALAQVNSTVGDLTGNAATVRAFAARAHEAGAHLVAFPEMMLTGYPIEDLTFRESFVQASKAALAKLAEELAADGLGELAVVVGYLDADGPARLGADSTVRRGPRDSLALLHRGSVAATYDKHHLPNYGVFDEDRYFVPGDTLTVVRAVWADGTAADIALSVCEDIWQPGGPFTAAGAAHAALVVNINASPYERNKDDVRLPLVARRAVEAGAAVAYVNLIGGQDELTFDGDSIIVGPAGELVTRSGQFTEELLVHDLDLPAADPAWTPPGAAAGLSLRLQTLATSWTEPAGDRAVGGVAERLPDEAEVWSALVLGLRDYVEKNRFKSVVVAVSGGIDSAVVAAIAVDALGPKRVVGVSMPSSYSSEHSKSDAADLAERTGLDYRVQPIAPMVDAFLGSLTLTGLAEENLQARVRGVVLMALSNQEGHLVLTTGNKSELAVGYSTLYGDSVGGFNPLKDVPKTLVWQLARWRNTVELGGIAAPIPENSISKPPSAELRPGQLDSDSLPDYELLDAILAGYVDGDLGRDQLIAAGHDVALVDRVIRMTDGAEYKRRQSAPGTKISFKAFGRDRRLPITNRWREGS
ncbi:NAD+ synthase (glutamine-hydrolyzing) [Hamadaea flava]|uniref:Glutamine-dependent NAD(+) synthetase n=1 Tax=Hamadaea flava TaxID=1742688 RepID=A0ABV8LKM4_9ACTN|nr:NAD+ synthase [Hamadaea flava]MCP2325005.1 NAD+ synthase (glutamine-hydrolyzing) [Hamadaea flava]